MFLLQKILSKIELKQFIAKCKVDNTLHKKKAVFQSVPKSIKIEEEKYINELLNKLSVLRNTKNIKATKRLKVLLTARLVKASRALQYYYGVTSSKLSTKRLSSNNFKQNLIVYVININLTNTNTLVSVTDIKGNVKIFYSSGQVNLKGKQKTKQPAALINILKLLIVKAKFIQNKPLALHFKNTKPYYESFIIRMLKKKFFIKTIRSYNLQPHNGCRPKKIKRFKRKKYIKRRGD